MNRQRRCSRDAPRRLGSRTTHPSVIDYPLEAVAAISGISLPGPPVCSLAAIMNPLGMTAIEIAAIVAVADAAMKSGAAPELTATAGEGLEARQIRRDLRLDVGQHVVDRRVEVRRCRGIPAGHRRILAHADIWQPEPRRIECAREKRQDLSIGLLHSAGAGRHPDHVDLVAQTKTTTCGHSTLLCVAPLRQR